MRVVVIFPLFLLCVMQNGFSHAQFQSCTISVMHLSLMHLSVTRNIKEQYSTSSVPLSNIYNICCHYFEGIQCCQSKSYAHYFLDTTLANIIVAGKLVMCPLHLFAPSCRSLPSSHQISCDT